MEKIAIGYIRVSTQEQASEDKFGIEAQKQAIQEYAKNNNYKIHQWFIDKVSGVKEDREEFDKILYASDIMNPPFEAVIVYKSDRVARDIKLYFHFEFILERKGVKLISVNDGFPEVAEEYKNIIKSFVLFSAEQERKNIALRTSHGRKLKASAGGYAGGRVPLGYYVDNGLLKIDEFEKPIVEYIFKLDNTANEKGYRTTYRDVAELVNKKGYRQRNGKIFTVGTVYQIIKNRKFYQGYYKYGKDSKWVKGLHERII